MAPKSQFVRAERLATVQERGCLAVQLEGRVVALFAHQDQIYAIDNRCPHMGFPLHQGTVKDGILTCHWHHARFDLDSGGTFDQWADDARAFPVEIRDGEVWVDVSPQRDARQHQRQRLQVGLERDLPLVLGKAVLVLADQDVEPFRAGLQFGTRYRRGGWGQGLTILTCMQNLLPYLRPADRSRALYQGLAAVSDETFGAAPRFQVRPLPDENTDLATLQRWFRQFIEVRDNEGAERCIVSAVRAGANQHQMASMLFAAITDHRYVDVGHPLDFTNKAFEALDAVGWEHAEQVLTSLVRAYANGRRMEESNAWRHPLDLIALLEEAFGRLPEALAQGQQAGADSGWPDRETLATVLLGDDPQASVEALLEALSAGCPPVELAGRVSYAAALRIARFHTSNEFNDWDTALHTFTFANAVEQGLRRAPTPELLRGVFDAAISVYLDRFLNIPAARLPDDGEQKLEPQKVLEALPQLLDRQQQVNQAGVQVAAYLYGGGPSADLLATLGHLLLREDRDFHTIQAVEAAFRQYQLLTTGASDQAGDSRCAVHVLVAAARYLAAHAPTVRSQGQTFEIARRLHQGERIYEGD
ncbi:MAG: Rieske (2Fe-2S) protein [Candidatus Promineifilaceae bacterium]|nr:Rieske (2Fe-2S) protein [Candidatus Promineifilaceae bacterium]